MSKFIDMTGWLMQEHGVPNSKIEVLEKTVPPKEIKPHGQYWKCKCLLCDAIFTARGDVIRSGKRKTCGAHKVKNNNDIKGQTFNYLTALENTYKVSSDRTFIWKCQCKCGNIKEVSRKNLITGDVKSCGCLNKEQSQKRKIDMIGKTFNYLTVLYELPVRGQNDKRIYYHCKCKCGNECDVDGIKLRNGNTKSCGCYKRERISEIKTKNLIGQTFGLLTVKRRYEESSKDGRVQWVCTCNCGNTKIISSHQLLSGNTISCGCANSYGESSIIKILNENNIDFLYNKQYYKDLVSKNNVPLRYDFIILQNNLPIRLIEFDGPQHEKPYAYFGGDLHFQETCYNDKLKNEYALSHNIPLVRIPYTERDKITLNLLMSDKYLVR